MHRYQVLPHNSTDVHVVESQTHASKKDPIYLLTPPPSSNVSLVKPSRLIIGDAADSPQKPMQVIIVTKMRSGSSFTGEIFNRNDGFVYYFEPLNEMKVDKKDTKASFMGASYEMVLNGILKCNFSNFKTFNWWNGRRPRQHCNYSNTFQNTSLCNSWMKQGYKEYSVSTTVTDAQNIALNEATCRSRRHIAVKTVRISDIGSLKGLITDHSLNVKILHLVRDPRATSNSRQDIHDPDNPRAECAKMENNLKYWLDPPDWIKDRYMLLRYEDLAERSHYTLEAVYSFLNLKAPSSVVKWFDINTKAVDKTRNKWSHTRQSNKTAHAWRTSPRLKFDKILSAQRDCENVMQLLGYRPVTSQVQMRDKGVSTLERLTYPLLPNRTST